MVAIKDMEMPKNCAECPMYNSDVDDYCDITGEWITGEEMVRPKDCPLVEIITCKDCKHKVFFASDNEGNTKYMCDIYCKKITDDNFYCSYGERSE